MSNWSYKNYDKWPKMYPQCSVTKNPNQSPINIDIKNIKQECGTKCEIVIKYKPSKCFLVNNHNTIIINYDPGSYIIFQEDWYELTKAEIRVPSLHTLNGEHYGAELNLYHCIDKQCSGGIVLSILLNRGPDNGDSVDFINQFINQAPVDDTEVEREVTVSDNWNIVNMIPEDRTCFIYNGSLPYPPCNGDWKWIVFNQPSRIGMSALKLLEHNIVKRDGKNIRPTFNLTPDRIIYKVSHDWVKVYEERPIKENEVKLEDDEADSLEKSVAAPVNIDSPSSQSLVGSYLEKYRKKIKNFMLFVLFILIVILAMKYAKYIIKNDLINKYLNRKVDQSNNSGNGKVSNGNITENNANVNLQLNQALNQGVAQA